MPEESNRPPETMPTSAEEARVGQASPPPSKGPLITAIEIENFKGIGAPVRIDLRPITLLFGRNSAGKSTILQALCYAHEILSHRNVDVHKTELGGDQIDLGGFRQFVHGHDLDRVIRIRFELNLKDWRVPAPLMSAIQGALNTGDPDSDEANRQWFDQHNPANTTRTGWVAFTAAWDRSRGTPALTSYEVGVNGRLVGRIEADSDNDTRLAFNWAHPLCEPFGGGQPALAHSAIRRVGETANLDNDEWQLLRAAVESGLQTPVPDWDRILDLDVDSKDMDLLEDTIGSPHYLTIFEALVSSVLVGIGRTLRDELANLRYLGPVRELRPHTAVGPSPHEQGSWSDGEAAWNLLLRHNPYPAASPGSDLLKSVNDWLTHADRLDTGYKLRRQSTIELAADAPWVGLIRLHERYLAEFRDENGVVDVDRWVRKEAAALATLYGRDHDDLAARIRTGRNYDSGSTSPNDADQDAPADEHIEASHKFYQVLVELVTRISKLEQGDPPAVKALVRAIAEAREQSNIEIVTAESELPVRTSDIGVGVSQILPWS